MRFDVTYIEAWNRDYNKLINQAKKAQNENTVRVLLTKSQRKTFKKHFKECRDDIEHAYLDYSCFMYDFLLPFER